MRIKFLILAISLFLASFSITTFADEKDMAYDIADTLFCSLSTQYSFDEDEDEVSRADFLYNLVELSGISKLDYQENTYSDVKTEDRVASAVATALANGWIEPGEKFNPRAKITLAQAIKIGVCMIGYGPIAEHEGGWYSGYATVGSDMGFLESVNNRLYTSNITKRDACVIIYNILQSDTMKYKGGQIIGSTDSILETYRNLYSIDGLMSANYISSLYGDDVLAEGEISINNEIFMYNDGIDLLGYNVRAYYTKNEYDEKEIVCTMPYKNNTVKFTTADFDYVDGKTVTYSKGNSENRVKLDENFYYIKNGEAKSMIGMNIEDIFTQNSAEFTLIDHNNNGVYDVLSAKVYRYTYVYSVDLFNGYIYDTYSAANMIDLSDDETVYKVKSLEGGKYFDASLEEIMSGLVVACAGTEDNKYVELVICYDSITGVPVATDSIRKTVRIGENTYYRSSYFDSYCVLELGVEADVLMGINNEVVVVDQGNDDKIKYAWLIKLRISSDDDKPIIKLFSQTGGVFTYEFAEKVFVDGIRIKNENVKEFIEGNVDLTEDYNRIIKYRLNNEGKVYVIDTVTRRVGDISAALEKTKENNSLRLTFDGSYIYRSDVALFGGKFSIKTTPYIFVIPPEAERDDDNLYKLVKNDYFKFSTYNVKAYDVAIDGVAKVILYVGTASAGDAKMKGLTAVVEKMAEELNQEEDACTALYIKGGDGYKVVYLPSNYTYSTEAQADIAKLTCGDIIRYTVDSYNNITDFKIAYDFDTHTINDNDYKVDDARVEFNEGFLYSKGNDTMYIVEPDKSNRFIPKMPMNLATANFWNISLAKGKFIFVEIFKSSDGRTVRRVNVHNAPKEELRTYIQSGAKASFVVCFSAYKETHEIFVYNIQY